MFAYRVHSVESVLVQYRLYPVGVSQNSTGIFYWDTLQVQRVTQLEASEASEV